MNLNKLKAVFKEYNLTYETVSKKTKIRYSTFKNKMAGYSPFDVDEATKISDFLNLDADRAKEIFLS